MSMIVHMYMKHGKVAVVCCMHTLVGGLGVCPPPPHRKILEFKTSEVTFKVPYNKRWSTDHHVCRSSSADPVSVMGVWIPG